MNLSVSEFPVSGFRLPGRVPLDRSPLRTAARSGTSRPSGAPVSCAVRSSVASSWRQAADIASRRGWSGPCPADRRRTNTDVATRAPQSLARPTSWSARRTGH